MCLLKTNNCVHILLVLKLYQSTDKLIWVPRGAVDLLPQTSLL
jgi:hypothetical protein